MHNSTTLALPKTDLSLYDNSWYRQPAAWRVALWMLCSVTFINNYLPIPIFLKIFVLKAFGAKIGRGIVIKPGVKIKYPWLLSVGNFVWIGEDVWIDNLVQVTIESHACLSQGSMLLTGNHDFKKSTFDLKVGNITIREGVWISAKATVCPGVVCNSHAVLAVNSVATKNLEAYGIYQGNPAIWQRERLIQS